MASPLTDNEALFQFLLRMGDNTLILGHRVSEWCGHSPVLEEDIALANTALDLIGQTQMWLGLAGEVQGDGKSADDLAFLRDVWDFRNVLLVDDSIVRGTTCKQIIQMARDAGAKNVYFASAAPEVRFPNVYGIDMPAARELIAHDRTVEEIQELIGADWLVYQDLEDLVQCAQEGNEDVMNFDCSVFNGEYLTGDICDNYLMRLEQSRNDANKRKANEDEANLDLHNDH